MYNVKDLSMEKSGGKKIKNDSEGRRLAFLRNCKTCWPVGTRWGQETTQIDLCGIETSNSRQGGALARPAVFSGYLGPHTRLRVHRVQFTHHAKYCTEQGALQIKHKWAINVTLRRCSPVKVDWKYCH